MYGNPDRGNRFIGFEYGRINSLYDQLHYCYKGELKFTSSEVPDEIKETYPNLVGSCHAIIQNVRNSHYVSGKVMHGYWVYSDSDYGLCDTIGDDLDHRLNKNFIDHNMTDTNSVPSHIFIGIQLMRLNTEDTEELAWQLSRSYSPKNSRLSSREDVLKVLHEINPSVRISEIPMLCLIQTICYCCTW
jgi:hypothetical protein